MGRGSATLCPTVRVPKIALFNLLMAVIFNNHYHENITEKRFLQRVIALVYYEPKRR